MKSFITGQDAISSELSRRAWLRNAAVFGLGLTANAALPGIGHAAGEPRRGGILSVWTSGEAPNFDPFSNTTSYVLHAVAPCYNSLLMMDPLNPDKIVGDLAQSWDLSADGKVYTFRLVQNAKFHDGKPLTSADVKHTFDLLRDPPTGMISVRKSLLSAVESIDTPDPFVVRFKLARPNPSLLASLATGWFVVCPKHILEAKGDMKKDVIGSGPFMFKQITRGVSLELVRNPNYHVKDRPYLDGITYYVVPDPSTAYANLRTGQLHLYDGLGGNDARRAERELSDRVNVHRDTSYIGDPFTMNSLRKPFDDIRVRKALALSVDHAEAVAVVNEGDGIVAGLAPKGLWGLAPEELAKVPGYGKDIAASRAEAKRLLAEAGYPTGFSTTITGRKGAGTHDARMVFLADQFSKIGVTAKINGLETAVYFNQVNQRNFDVATNVISSLANDPDFLFGDFHTCKGSLNYSGVCVAEIDDLFERQSQTVDPVERKKLVNQMELAALNAFGTVNLYFKIKHVVTSKKVNNYVMHPEPDNNRRMQEIWLSA